MEVQTYESIIEKMNNLGTISVRNIDEYVRLSNDLVENLEKINQIDVEVLINNKNIENYKEILSQVNTYKHNRKYIKKVLDFSALLIYNQFCVKIHSTCAFSSVGRAADS